MIAKVSFGVLGHNAGNSIYKFGTDQSNLNYGEFVIVDALGERQVAVFMGYEKYKTEYKPNNNIVRRADIEEISSYWKEYEDRLLKGKLKVSEVAYGQYITQFKDCQNLTKLEVEKKLIRNIILSCNFGNKRAVINGERMVYQYGNMRIHVKGVVVTKVEVKPVKYFKMDFGKRQYLNEVLGLEATV